MKIVETLILLILCIISTEYDLLYFFSTDGVVKTLHLLRCCIFNLITTYLSTPKLNEKYAPRIWSFLFSHPRVTVVTKASVLVNNTFLNNSQQVRRNRYGYND